MTTASPEGPLRFSLTGREPFMNVYEDAGGNLFVVRDAGRALLMADGDYLRRSSGLTVTDGIIAPTLRDGRLITVPEGKVPGRAPAREPEPIATLNRENVYEDGEGYLFLQRGSERVDLVADGQNDWPQGWRLRRDDVEIWRGSINAASLVDRRYRPGLSTKIPVAPSPQPSAPQPAAPAPAPQSPAREVPQKKAPKKKVPEIKSRWPEIQRTGEGGITFLDGHGGSPRGVTFVPPGKIMQFYAEEGYKATSQAAVSRRLGLNIPYPAAYRPGDPVPNYHLTEDTGPRASIAFAETMRQYPEATVHVIGQTPLTIPGAGLFLCSNVGLCARKREANRGDHDASCRGILAPRTAAVLGDAIHMLTCRGGGDSTGEGYAEKFDAFVQFVGEREGLPEGSEIEQTILEKWSREVLRTPENFESAPPLVRSYVSTRREYNAFMQFVRESEGLPDGSAIDKKTLDKWTKEIFRTRENFESAPLLVRSYLSTMKPSATDPAGDAAAEFAAREGVTAIAEGLSIEDLIGAIKELETASLETWHSAELAMEGNRRGRRERRERDLAVKLQAASALVHQTASELERIATREQKTPTHGRVAADPLAGIHICKYALTQVIDLQRILRENRSLCPPKSPLLDRFKRLSDVTKKFLENPTVGSVVSKAELREKRRM
ncbi:putative adhesin [Streptomyces sp. NPDC055085]